MFDLNSLLIPFFRELKINNIRYCILRGYEDLPQKTRYDVDIAIDESSLSLVLFILDNAAKESGWSLINSVLKNGFCRIILYHPDYEKITLPIDLMWKYQYRGISYSNNEIILNDTQQYNSLNVAHAGYESAISFIGKMIIGKGRKISSEKRIRIQKLAIEDKQRFISVLSFYFQKETINKLLKAIQIGDWEGAFSLRWKLIKESISKTGIIKFASSFAKSILESFKGKIHRRGTMSVKGGLFIVLLGPDGSGKTTIAKELDKELNTLFHFSKYYHGRFHLFPQLGGIKKVLNIFLKKRPGIKEGSTLNSNTIKRDKLSVIRSSINIIYYGFEYIFGRISIWIKLRKNTLIIVDRYFYDYLLHPEYVNAPRWLIMFFTKLIPQPDLIMLIKCDSKVIFKRKEELPLDEIERQQLLLNTFEKLLRKTVKINANQPLKNTINDAVRESLISLNLNYNKIVKKIK